MRVHVIQAESTGHLSNNNPLMHISQNKTSLKKKKRFSSRIAQVQCKDTRKNIIFLVQKEEKHAKLKERKQIYHDISLPENKSLQREPLQKHRPHILNSQDDTNIAFASWGIIKTKTKLEAKKSMARTPNRHAQRSRASARGTFSVVVIIKIRTCHYRAGQPTTVFFRAPRLAIEWRLDHREREEEYQP